MTLVMIWKDRADERLWAVSDSRVSDPKHAGRVRLTDRGAKLLEARAVLHRARFPDPNIPIKERTFGFAYAGSSLIALQAYAAVIPLWARLETPEANDLPSIRAFADHLAIFVREYALEVSSASSGACGQLVQCECALFGFDEQSRAFDGYVVSACLQGNVVSASLRQMTMSDPGTVQFMGNGKENASIELGKLCKELATQELAREPLQYIRQFIANERRDDVGGGVQIGIATRHGFSIHFDVQPLSVGSGAATAKYRGFDVSKIGQVGDARVFLSGFA